jgi:hypothetical protein
LRALCLKRSMLPPDPPHPAASRPTSPTQVGYIRLAPHIMPNSGKPEFGKGEVPERPSHVVITPIGRAVTTGWRRGSA